jgi:hypothetical protein
MAKLPCESEQKKNLDDVLKRMLLIPPKPHKKPEKPSKAESQRKPVIDQAFVVRL